MGDALAGLPAWEQQRSIPPQFSGNAIHIWVRDDMPFQHARPDLFVCYRCWCDRNERQKRFPGGPLLLFKQIVEVARRQLHVGGKQIWLAGFLLLVSTLRRPANRDLLPLSFDMAVAEDFDPLRVARA